MSQLLKGRKILVVDDEALLREVLREELESAGAQTAEASGGHEAFTLLQSEPGFDAVVSDMRMAQGNGDVLLEKLKALNPISPAVILMSAYSMQSSEVLYAKGADAILTKPFSFPDLPTLVWKVLRPIDDRLSFRRPVAVDNELDAGAETIAKIGRGGVFVQGPRVSALRYGSVRFSLLVKIEGDSQSYELKGEGDITWLRPKDAVAGIEFAYLEPASLQTLKGLLQKAPPVAFIPNK